MSDATTQQRPVNPELLRLLVCPIDKAKLELAENELVCSQCGRHYPIENGIPNMLIEDISE